MTADKLIFILMLISAAYIVISRNYRRIIITLGAFSLLASFCYLIYHAPDVAIAEAVIGSALSTILFIVALKKHRVFHIYFISDSKDARSDHKVRAKMEDVISHVMLYCSNHDLEAQAIFSWEKIEKIKNEHLYDLILHSCDNSVVAYGRETELHVVAIKDMLEKDFSKDRVKFIDVGFDI